HGDSALDELMRRHRPRGSAADNDYLPIVRHNRLLLLIMTWDADLESRTTNLEWLTHVRSTTHNTDMGTPEKAPYQQSEVERFDARGRHSQLDEVVVEEP